MKLSGDVLDVLRDGLVFVATSSGSGVPNVVPIGFARPLDESTILIADNFMDKTRKNLEENPKIALIPKEAAKCPYQFKGTVQIFTSGKYFDEVTEWGENAMTKLKPKAAILMKIQETYTVKPGPQAGKKLE